MKLVVGLGNPGKTYEETRHNVGFMVLDQYAKKHHLNFQKEKFHGLYTDFQIGEEKIILLKPQSFINLSGEVVRKFVDFYKISIDDILVVHDDLDLALGVYKLKPSGSSAGHNGLKNIELHIGTKNYKHFKIGISNNKNIDAKDYVLGKFYGEEKETLDSVLEESLVILEDYFECSFDILMNRYNGKK